MDGTLLSNDLIMMLTLLAIDWAMEAQRYQRSGTFASDNRRAFWQGMSFGFLDSTGLALKLLRRPTVQGLSTLARLLEKRKARAEHRYASRHQAFNINAQTYGIVEAYGRCSFGLRMSLVESIRSLKTPVNYLC